MKAGFDLYSSFKNKINFLILNSSVMKTNENTPKEFGHLYRKETPEEFERRMNHLGAPGDLEISDSEDSLKKVWKEED